MREDRLEHEYFEWLYDLVSRDRFARSISYRNLLRHLHSIQFIYSIPRDKNRAEDGISLRRRFSYDLPDDEVPCTILEMMIALDIRCEEEIMDDTAYGDRTGNWFWSMIGNLGLGGMSDERYDPELIEDVIWRFQTHRYDRDGTGGLFKIRNCDRDLRKMEIWQQMCWYLDSIM